MNKQSKKGELCVIQHAALKNNWAYLLRTEKTKSHLNSRICQHRGMKTSTVTPSFYYVFNISLYCNDTIPSFIGNLWLFFYSGITLRRFPLTVFAHPYCARKFTGHVMHRARALSTKMNNDREDGHSYSFDWI